MAKVTIEQGETEYQLVVDDAESGTVPYGEPCEIAVGGKTYLALCDREGGDGDVVSLFDKDWVICGNAVPAEIEDVDFEGGEDDEDEAEVTG